MKVMLLGDTHGNVTHVNRACRAARAAGAELIIQLGDWGFLWPPHDRLGELEEVLWRYGMPMWFVDGNHDDHERLPHDATGPVRLSEHVTYLPRGYRFELGGVTFLTLGGAVSVDKGRRVPFVTWWPDEAIRPGDVWRAWEGGPVDVMLTHDAPTPTSGPLAALIDGYKDDPDSVANRAAVTAVMEATSPRLLVHGHYHHRYNTTIGDTVVCGLNRDDTGASSWVVIDTNDLDAQVTAVRQAAAPA